MYVTGLKLLLILVKTKKVSNIFFYNGSIFGSINSEIKGFCHHLLSTILIEQLSISANLGSILDLTMSAKISI